MLRVTEVMTNRPRADSRTLDWKLRALSTTKPESSASASPAFRLSPRSLWLQAREVWKHDSSPGSPLSSPSLHTSLR